MRYLIALVLLVLMVGLVLYLLVRPHKDGLDEKHGKYFSVADNLFGPLLRLTSGAAKPYKVGPNAEVDLGPAILMAVFAVLSLMIIVR